MVAKDHNEQVQANYNDVQQTKKVESATSQQISCTSNIKKD